MKTLIYIFIVVLAAATSPTSCQEEDPEREQPAIEVNDEWEDSVAVPLE